MHNSTLLLRRFRKVSPRIIQWPCIHRLTVSQSPQSEIVKIWLHYALRSCQECNGADKIAFPRFSLAPFPHLGRFPLFCDVFQTSRIGFLLPRFNARVINQVIVFSMAGVDNEDWFDFNWILRKSWVEFLFDEVKLIYYWFFGWLAFYVWSLLV